MSSYLETRPVGAAAAPPAPALGVALARALAVPLLMLAATLLFRATSFLPSVIDTDEGLYLLQGREWLQGRWPLVGVWDMHPVGAPAMVAAAFALFGESVATMRLLGSLCVAATATALYAMVRIAGAPRGVGIAAGLLYTAHSVLLTGLATNTELLFAPFSTAAMAVAAATAARALRDGQAPRWRDLAVMGLLIGWGLVVKPVVVFIGCFAFLVFTVPALWRRTLSLRRFLAMAAAYAVLCATPCLLMAGAYWLRGELDAFLDGSFYAPLRYAEGRLGAAAALRHMLTGMLTLLWLFALAALALPRLRRPTTPGWARLLVGVGVLWFAAATLAIIGPGMFYSHYFLIWLPPLALLASLGAWRLANLLQGRAALAGFAALIAVVAAEAWRGELVPLANGETVLDRPDPPREVARILRAELRPGEPIFVANYHPAVYFLARAGVPTPYAFPAHLTGRFGGVACIDMNGEVARVLGTRPRFIVVDRGWWSSVRRTAAAEITATLRAGYELFRSVDEERGPIEIWRRRG